MPKIIRRRFNAEQEQWKQAQRICRCKAHDRAACCQPLTITNVAPGITGQVMRKAVDLITSLPFSCSSPYCSQFLMTLLGHSIPRLSSTLRYRTAVAKSTRGNATANRDPGERKGFELPPYRDRARVSVWPKRSVIEWPMSVRFPIGETTRCRQAKAGLRPLASD